MIWFPFSSFFRKSKPDPAADDSGVYSHPEEISKSGRGSKKDSPVDPVLPEKKRARRRLVGAIALTLGLVIALPMLLDSEPKPVSDEIVIRIPSRDKPVRASAPVKSPSVSVSAATKSEPAPTEPVAATVQVAAPAQTASPDAVQKQSATNDVKAAVKPVEPKASEPEKPVAKPAAEPARKPSTEGKVIIQVAALATQQKVNELQAQLKSAGLKSYTQKVATAGGDRIRVRVGPFDSKSEAQQTCAKLGKMRLNCTILPG